MQLTLIHQDYNETFDKLVLVLFIWMLILRFEINIELTIALSHFDEHKCHHTLKIEQIKKKSNSIVSLCLKLNLKKIQKLK